MGPVLVVGGNLRPQHDRSERVDENSPVENCEEVPKHRDVKSLSIRPRRPRAEGRECEKDCPTQQLHEQ